MYECKSKTKIVNPFSQFTFIPDDYSCNTQLKPRILYIFIDYTTTTTENTMKFYYDKDFNNPENLVTSIIFNIFDNHITFDPKENRQHPGIKIEKLVGDIYGIIASRITVEFTSNNLAVSHGFVNKGDIYTFSMKADPAVGDTIEISVLLYNDNSISVNS